MMIDNLLVLSDAQAVTAAAASTNVIDLTSVLGSAAMTSAAKVQFLVDTTAAATGGASNVTFSLQDSADNSSFADVVRSVAIAKATLVAGYVAFQCVIPAGLRRYVRAYYTPDTNDLTSGKFDARILLDVDRTIDKNL